MKLYTEEQVRKAIAMGFDWCHQKQIPSDWMVDNLIKELTPTELPSDEEVHKSSPHQILNSNNSWDIGFHNGWKHGAKWMRDKIQGKITPNQ